MAMSDLLTAVNEIRENAHDYRRAEDYYYGRVGELFASPQVRRALRGQSGGFDVNLAARPVDAVLDRMRITAVAVPDDETATRRLMDEIWTPNRMDRYSKTVHWAGLVYGDAYLVVWDGDNDGSVDLFYNTPITTRVFYDPENPRRKSFAAKVWCEGEDENQVTRVTLYYPDRIEKYISDAGGSGDRDSDFQPYRPDGENWPIPNPYGQVPVFHFRTSDPYGHPEHRGAFGPQNAITKLIATQMATTDFQGFPQRYALLNSTEDLLDWDQDSETAEPGRDTDLRANPGELWKLPNTTKVGEFSTADPDAFLKPISAYIRMMAAATATPLRFFDPQGQIPSGEALRADEAPLTERITDRQDWFGEEWGEALVFASLVAGHPAPSVAVSWRPVQVVDDLTGWQAIQAKITAGVPTEHALTEAGYPSDVVSSWLAGSEEPSLATRVAMLKEIGQAAQFLGAAVQMGAITPELVAQVIDQTVGGLVTDGTQS